MARGKIVTANKQPDKEKIIRKVKDKIRQKQQDLKMLPKKESFIGPRLRLEPRLLPIKSPNSCIDNNSNTSPMIKTETTLSPVKKCMKSAFAEGIKLPDTIKFQDKTNDGLNLNFPSDSDNSYKSVRNKIGVLKSCPVTTHASTSSFSKLQFKQRLKRKPQIFKGRTWHDEELLSLATALQKHGFKDTQKIAQYLNTKSENQIKDYIKFRTLQVRAEVNAKKLDAIMEDPNIVKDSKDDKCETSSNCRGRPKNKWSRVSPDHFPHWPNVRKWRRLASDQMMPRSRNKDYSKSAITSLLMRFYEEEEDTSDPQVINVKSIYKYLLDSLSDEIPAQLAPKESALMMDLLKDLRLLPLVYDFDEDVKFLEGYKEAIRYKPFQIKDEFKKKFTKKEKKEDSFSPNSIYVPEEIFTNLSRHRKVVQCFNPLTIPVWMMQKGQEYMEQLF